MKRKSLYKKIEAHQIEIIFGILAGVGVFGISSVLENFLAYLIPKISPYSLVLNIIIYIFMTYTTSLYVKGWFRNIYIIPSLGLMLSYIYYKIVGAVF